MSDCTLVTMDSADVTGKDVVMPLNASIQGTVTGPNGQALAGIEVSANKFGTTTGADGTYSLPVPAGDYTISFRDNNGAHPDGCYSAGGFTTDWNACTPVVMSTSILPGIDITMPLGYHISGTVTGPDGILPLANIHFPIMKYTQTYKFHHTYLYGIKP